MLPKRHNRRKFTWLMRRVTGNGNALRGEVCSRCGDVKFHAKGKPRTVSGGAVLQISVQPPAPATLTHDKATG